MGKNVKTTNTTNYDQSQFNYKCALCEISFSNETILKNHHLVAHQNADQLQKDTLQKSKRVTKDSKIKTPVVTQMSSGKLADKNNPLKKRVIMVKRNKNMVKKGKNKLQTQNDYKCELCEETFSQKTKLQKHLKLCLKKQFSSFSKASFLKSALKDKTNQPDIKNIKLQNRKLYKCRMCNLSFSRKIRLEKHIGSKHENDQNKEIAEDQNIISNNSSPEQELSNIDGKTGSTVSLRSNARHTGICSKKQKKSEKTDQAEPKIDSNKKETDRLSIFVEDEFI